MNPIFGKQEGHKMNEKEIKIALNYDIAFHSKELEQPGVSKQASHIIQKNDDQLKGHEGSPIKQITPRHIIDLSKYTIRNFKSDGVSKENAANIHQQRRSQELIVGQVKKDESLLSPSSKQKRERKTHIFRQHKSKQQILLTDVQNRHQRLQQRVDEPKEKVVIGKESMQNIQTLQKIEDYPQDSFYSHPSSKISQPHFEPVHDGPVNTEPEEHRSFMKKSRRKIFHNTHVEHFEASSHIMNDSYINQFQQESKQKSNIEESKVTPYIKISEPPHKQGVVQSPKQVNQGRKLDESQIISFGNIPHQIKEPQL